LVAHGVVGGSGVWLARNCASTSRSSFFLLACRSSSSSMRCTMEGSSRRFGELRSERQPYAEYGITQYETGDYEVDHLIPLSLGGSNSIRNLWLQSTKTLPWNSFVKDALERKFHKLICGSRFDLKSAQRETSPMELAQKVGMKPQAICNQLRRLSDRGIIERRREGKQVYYRIVDPCVIGLLDRGLWVIQVWQSWTARRRSLR